MSFPARALSKGQDLSSFNFWFTRNFSFINAKMLFLMWWISSQNENKERRGEGGESMQLNREEKILMRGWLR
jgi:hypothetical protein